MIEKTGVELNAEAVQNLCFLKIFVFKKVNPPLMLNKIMHGFLFR